MGRTDDDLFAPSAPGFQREAEKPLRLLPTQRASAAFEEIAPRILGLSPEQRVEFFGMLAEIWCRHCGHSQPDSPRGCQCENDT